MLGVKVGKNIGFPVGKVKFLNLYPMNFYEFLLALGESLIAEELKRRKNIIAFFELIHNKLTKLLKTYLILGGMPEVIKTYIETQDITASREIQNDILESYKRDFSKYSDRNLFTKISHLWNSIPLQLSRENKKFKYRDINKKARNSTYYSAIEWLKNSGLINIVYSIKKGLIPLSGYIDFNKFKIYFNDVGLLGALLRVPPRIIIHPDKIFSEYNGAFIENYVLQELLSINFEEIFYWTSKSDAEVDFIIQYNGNIFPIEVKSGKRRDIKSLRSYEKKYNPKLLVRVSPRNFYMDNNFVNIPLYAVNFLKNTLNLFI